MALTEEAKAKAVEMYDRGEKTTAIYRETGVSRPALYMILRQQGVTPNRQRDRRYTPELNAEHLLHRLEAAQARIGALEAELAITHARISELEEQLTADVAG